MSRTSRNDPCSCGSKKKFKKCCALKVGLEKYKTTKLQASKISSDIVAKISGFSKDASTNLVKRIQKTI